MALTSDKAPGPGLEMLGVAAAAQAMRRGELAAESYARALLAHNRRHRWLNAFISLDEELLLEAARRADQARAAGEPMGPLHGVPLAIKDNIETREYATTAGTEALRDFHPGRDAPVVQRLAHAGALILGKANMHELAIGATSNNPTYGAVQNPYRRGYHPSGSSGGTGAAVAARLAPAGLGSDTAGSVRNPASLCGIVGLRPTMGRYPGAGIVPLSPVRDTVGPMARSVEDMAILDGVMSGAPVLSAAGDLRGIRIGVPRPYYWDELDSETARVSSEALRMLTEAGAVLVEAPMDRVVEINSRIGLSVVQFEALRDLPRYLEESGSGVSLEDLVAGIKTPNVRGFFAAAMKPGALSEKAYREALDVHKPALQRAYGDYFRDNGLTATVMPTTPLPSRPHDPGDMVEYLGERVYARVYLRNIDASANAGIPSLSVPAGLTRDGLPVGLLFDGPAGSEKTLFGIARAFERVAPTLPPPPLWG